MYDEFGCFYFMRDQLCLENHKNIARNERDMNDVGIFDSADQLSVYFLLVALARWKFEKCCQVVCGQ